MSFFYKVLYHYIILLDWSDFLKNAEFSGYSNLKEVLIKNLRKKIN